MSLTLRDIWFRYPRSDQDLLRGISLHVSDGESVALMAPSGSGKTTLLNVAGLLDRPARGEVMLDEEQLSHADAGRVLGSRIGWVLQTVSLMPRRTVLDNVILPCLAHGLPRPEATQKAIAVLKRLGLENHVHRPASTLSGGEAQRAGVARALVNEPSLLIADEPTANLDHRTALSVAEHLILSARTTSLLLATHDPAIAAMTDRVVRL